jgi:hypothetical protein
MRLVCLIAVMLAGTMVAAAAAGAAPDPKQPRQQHTAIDMVRARSIALKGSDLGRGWGRVRRDTTPCTAEPDESGLVQTASADNTYLSPDRRATVASRVAIFKSRREAARDWKLATLRVVAGCLLERTRAQYASSNVAVHIITALALRPPTRGERSLHYRVALLLSAGSQSIPLVTDFVGIGIGRISVLLRTSIPAAPIPDRYLQQLTGLLTKRLIAAAGGI